SRVFSGGRGLSNGLNGQVEGRVADSPTHTLLGDTHVAHGRIATAQSHLARPAERPARSSTRRGDASCDVSCQSIANAEARPGRTPTCTAVPEARGAAPDLRGSSLDSLFR